MKIRKELKYIIYDLVRRKNKMISRCAEFFGAMCA